MSPILWDPICLYSRFCEKGMFSVNRNVSAVVGMPSLEFHIEYQSTHTLSKA
jgi:hypothetical protein